MPHPHLDWRTRASTPISIANARVALALVRVFRRVPLPHDEADLVALARCLWPVARLFPDQVRDGLLAAPLRRSRKRPHGFPEDDSQRRAQAVRALASGRRTLPREPGDEFVLEILGDALVNHTPAFRPLYDMVEAELARNVTLRRANTDGCIELLSALLHLAPLETAFLRLCAAVAASSITGSFFCLARAPLRMFQGVQAALDASDEHEVRSMLRRNSRLVRSGLIDADSLGSRADMEDALRLSRQAMLILSSRARTVTAMASAVLRRTPAPSDEDLKWPHLEPRARLLRDLLTGALAQGAQGVNILLHGEPGTGKTQFASRLVATLGAQAFSVADTDTDGDPANRAERLASLTLTQLFAPAGRSIVLLDEAEDVFQNEYNNPMARAFGKREDGKSWMNHLLEENRHPVIWISNRIDQIDPAYLRRFTCCVEFPRTPRQVRREIARAHLEPVGCSAPMIDALAAEPDVSPAVLASAARLSRLVGPSAGRADETVGMVIGGVIKALGGRFGGRLPERSTRFDLRYLNMRGTSAPAAVIEGMARLGRGRVLLSGPPGTGKTQLASEIAQKLGRELIYKTASDVNSMWFGESERNVARMFQECDTAQEVLFLDEADTLMGSRENAPHRAELAVTAEFLRQVEAFTGVFVCATNFQAQLDAALLRRFEFRLEMLPLSGSQRRAMFCETALGWTPGGPMPALDASLDARLGRLDQLTPGDFANVVRRLRTLQLALDPSGWLDELEAEHGAKPGASRGAIGFV